MPKALASWIALGSVVCRLRTVIFRRLFGRRHGLVHLVQRNQGTVHHQADLAQDQQPGDQDQDILLGPTVGPQRVPFLDHIVQDDLPVGCRREVHEAAELIECLLVAVFRF